MNGFTYGEKRVRTQIQDNKVTKQSSLLSCHSEFISESIHRDGCKTLKQVQGDMIFNDEMVVYPQPFNPSTVQPLNHPSLKRKSAFTLAEVLITLGIIGVVAAMTMPALIGKYQKMVAKNQFKKMYAVLATAFNAAIQDMGGSTLCTVSNVENTATEECTQLWKIYLIKHLKVIKTCDSNAFENGCVPDYKEADFPGTQGCGGFAASQIKNKQPAFVLNDGTIIFPYGYNSGDLRPGLGFDINGFKGPNRGGYDVFSLGVDLKGGTPVLGGWKDGYLSYCLPMFKGAYFYYLRDVLH